jgi:hypothetical protein
MIFLAAGFLYWFTILAAAEKINSLHERRLL